MVTLALLRHAKAVRDDAGGDHARSLSGSGREDAEAAGRWLRHMLTAPVLVLASDARRTRETAELAFPTPRPQTELRFEADLYGASGFDLVTRLRALGTEPTVVLVGHNPGIGDAARLLAGSGEVEPMSRLRDGYPTCTASVLQFEGAWAELAPARGRLTALFLCKQDG